MGKVRNTHIISDDKIFSDLDKRNSFQTEFYEKKTETDRYILEIFTKQKLIKNSMRCLYCNNEMSLIYKRINDQLYLDMQTALRKARSVFTDSFFEKTNIPLSNFLFFYLDI